jgi:hypothetical protein
MVGIMPEYAIASFDPEPAAVWAFVSRTSGCGIGLRRWGHSTLLCTRGVEERLPSVRGQITVSLDLEGARVTFEDDGVPIPGGTRENIELCTYRFAAALGFDGSAVAIVS